MQTKDKFRTRPRTVRVIKLAASFAVFVAAGVFLAALTVFHAFPLARLEARLDAALNSRAGLGFSSDSLERSFPFVIKAYDVKLARARDKAVVMRFDELRAAFKPLSIFTGALRAGLSGASQGGSLTGDMAIRPGGVNVSISGSGLRFSDIPALGGAGLGLSGTFDIESAIGLGSGCPHGRISIEGAGLEASDIRVMGLALPLGEITAAGAEVVLKDCAASIERAWIEGSALMARLNGSMAVKDPLGESPLKLTLEIVSRENAPPGSRAVLEFLGAYRRSANYYSIPIRGTLARPSFGG